MKELSIEEKAKRYDEAIERAEALYSAAEPMSGCNVIIETLFPALKESGDEKIRKSIIAIINNYVDNSNTFKPKMLAWLEKQGEQKSFNYENLNIQQNDFAPKSVWSENDFVPKSAIEAIKEEKVDNANKIEPKDYSSIDPHFFKPNNKVEPKFKVGDWVFIEEVKGHKDGPFQIKTVDSFGYSFDEYYTIPFMYEDLLSKWTLQDAKDGDVLYSLDSNLPFIYKERNDYEQATAYCGLNIYGKFFVWGTKDCVITLSNYVPATKEQCDTLMKAMADAGYTFDFDKKELKKIYNALEECEIEHGKYYYCIKDYYSGGCKRASKGEVVLALRGMSMMALGVNANEYFIPVKRIVDVRPAWGEEDEKMYQETIDWFEKKCFPYALESENPARESIKWLKSIKGRYTWKPSDEQVEALKGVQEGVLRIGILESLYQDLKALKGE
jgi:hypothetical protein